MKRLLATVIVALSVLLAGCGGSHYWVGSATDNKDHPECFQISWHSSSWTGAWSETPEGLFCRVKAGK